MPASTQSATASVPAASGEVIVVDSPATASEQAIPLPTPAEVAIDIAPSPSKESTSPTSTSATSGDVGVVDSPGTASKQAMPLPTPAEVAFDIPSSPSKDSIPPTSTFATPEDGWIFIDITLAPTKEPPVVPPAGRSSKPERICFAVILLLVIGLLSWIVFTKQVYTKGDPQFQIDSASVDTSAANYPIDHYIRADWRVGITVRNPNKYTPIVYKMVAVRMSRNWDEFEVSDAIAAPFRQEPKNVTALIARSEPHSEGTKLRYEILETILEFNVTMVVELSYKCRTCLREKWFELEVFCPEVNVFHASKGPNVGGSQQCSVQRRRQMN